MTQTRGGLVIPTTILIAFILTLLPMPDWTVWLRPAWVMMVIIYWVMVAPHRVNVGIAWLVGLFLDVLNGTLLGEHALAMTLVAYFVARMHSRLRMFPLLQQGFSVFILILIYQFVLFCVQGFLGQLPSTWLYWSSSVTSMLLWPWLFSMLRDWRRRSI
ncbi:MAG: rod shape-determining protein MreD [Gammaproteobacteria bacterium]